MDSNKIKDDETTELLKFIFTMNNQLERMEEFVNELLNFKNRLYLEESPALIPALENEKIVESRDDILCKLESITVKIDIENDKFWTIIKSLNKLV
jgi:hypothetical protein